MKKNIFLIIGLGLIPEIIVANYLKDSWNMDFFEALISLYGILFGLWLIRFFIGEISFRLFVQKKFIDTLYSQLVEKKFPNPWNYYMDDGLSYFQEVGRNVNNENINNDVCSMAAELYGQIKGLYDANQLSIYFRFKRCLKFAVKKFMDNHFPNSMNDLKQEKSYILDLFIKNNFPNPSKYSFNDYVEYLNQVVSDNKINYTTKVVALGILGDHERKRSEIIYSQMNYDLDKSEEIHILEKESQQYQEAILDYSSKF